MSLVLNSETTHFKNNYQHIFHLSNIFIIFLGKEWDLPLFLDQFEQIDQWDVPDSILCLILIHYNCNTKNNSRRLKKPVTLEIGKPLKLGSQSVLEKVVNGLNSLIIATPTFF
jgi:hypothetical protein